MPNLTVVIRKIADELEKIGFSVDLGGSTSKVIRVKSSMSNSKKSWNAIDKIIKKYIHNDSINGAETNSLKGNEYSIKIKPLVREIKMKDKLSLKKMLNEEWGMNKEPKLTSEDTNLFYEKVKNFNVYGESIYRKGNLREVALELSKIAEIAKHVTLSETSDWFDKVTVNRNMKALDGISKEFNKTASEAQSIQERLSSLYEDMGLIFNRYFNIESIKKPNINDQPNDEEQPEIENPKKEKIKKVIHAVDKRNEKNNNKSFIKKAAKAIQKRKMK